MSQVKLCPRGLIDTCVLYIDIRRSTELNLKHRPATVAKLYSAFVRAMTRCARYFDGHVRGIIGDRVMVLFDCKDAFVNAVNCAVAMNSTSKHVINKHFPLGEVECGIGIDAGRMLATKTGIRRRGSDQGAYRNLVWLGRPANVASKLTDLANKPGEDITIPIVWEAHSRSLLGGGLVWRDTFPSDFVRKLSAQIGTKQIQHADFSFETMIVTDQTYTTRPRTPPILMTAPVWDGYRAAAPGAQEVVNGWINQIDIPVPGYTGKIYGGDVIYTVFNPPA